MRGAPAEQVAALRALSTLSPEDRDLLAAVQESPYRLTTLEQFREFPANTEYFILEANISKVEDVGWRYLRSIWTPFCPRNCWTPLTRFPSANTPCRRNRAASPAGDI